MAAFTSSPKPSRLAHQREEGAARRRIRLTCMSANLRCRRPRAPWRLRQPGQQRPNLEGARASRPDRKNLRFPAERTGFAREESVAVVARPVEPGERLKGKEATLPRCREANGGVAVVAAVPP